MSDSAGINWSMWEAIGSVGAVVLALLLTAGRWIWDWWNSPNVFLSISYREVEPSLNFRHLDIMIKNKGRETAKKVTIKIERIEFPDSHRVIQNLEPRLSLIESLQWEDYVSLEFITISSNNNRLLISPTDATYAHSRQDCMITLLITGDNFKGFRRTLRYIDSKEICNAELKL